MSKTDLSDACMHIWIEAADVPKLTFSVSPLPSDPKPLIGFHLSLPTGHNIENNAYFCAASKTVADFANSGSLYPLYPLEQRAQTVPKFEDSAADGIIAPADNAAPEASFASLSEKDW